jgi:hypothetical protein
VRGVGESRADGLELAQTARGSNEAPSRSHAPSRALRPGAALL